MNYHVNFSECRYSKSVFTQPKFRVPLSLPVPFNRSQVLFHLKCRYSTISFSSISEMPFSSWKIIVDLIKMPYSWTSCSQGSEFTIKRFSNDNCLDNFPFLNISIFLIWCHFSQPKCLQTSEYWLIIVFLIRLSLKWVNIQ